MNRPSRGFTMVELVVVLSILAILLAFAIPHYVQLVRHTRATQAMADLYAVRAAGLTYFAENGTWPPEEARAQTPKPLVNYLPRDFSFRGKYYDLDWENWRTPNGKSSRPETGIVIGVSIVTNDLRLLQDVRTMFSNDTFKELAQTKYTLEILGAEGL